MTHGIFPKSLLNQVGWWPTSLGYVDIGMCDTNQLVKQRLGYTGLPKLNIRKPNTFSPPQQKPSKRRDISEIGFVVCSLPYFFQASNDLSYVKNTGKYISRKIAKVDPGSRETTVELDGGTASQRSRWTDCRKNWRRPDSRCWWKWMSREVDVPPKWMMKIMENPMNKWMIWGGKPLFLETSKWLGSMG